ncbi:MAG: MBL fold metallo-hydrolase [Spirochaetales bacterium]
MKVVTLGSGSKGNSTYIETDGAKILIDAGFTISELEKRLNLIGVEASNIDAIIITHEHSDHIKGVANFNKKYGTKIYAHSNLWGILEDKLGKIKLDEREEFFVDPFKINDLIIESFELPHDASYCVGFSLYNEGSKVSIATDLGYATKNIVEKLKNSNLLILEANHDISALRANTKYPSYLKRRILSNKGHLSNESAGQVLLELVNCGVQQVVLAHLSEQNNTPQIAFETVRDFLNKYGIIEGKHIFIDVAPQDKIGNIFNLK